MMYYNQCNLMILYSIGILMVNMIDTFFKSALIGAMLFVIFLILEKNIHYANYSNYFLPLVLLSLLISYFQYKKFFNIFKRVFYNLNFEIINGFILGSGAYFLFYQANFNIDLKILIIKIYVFMIIICTSYIWNSRCREQKEKTKKEMKLSVDSEIFFQSAGDFHPKQYIKDDSFNKTYIVNKISNLLIANPKEYLTIGINGPWGVGKTTFISFVKENIDRYCYSLYLSSLEYKNTESFSHLLLHKIGNILDTISGKSNVFAKLFDSLSADYSIKDSYFNLNLLANLKLKIPRKELKQIIIEKLDNYIISQLIIFIDDLDRLTKPEVLSVLRTIQLLDDLPKIRFVLVYDKKCLFNLLYENEYNRSIDYFSKIVQFELNMALPSFESKKELLIKTIAEIKNNNIEGLTELHEFISDEHALYYLFLLIQTPRELKRILACTLWLGANFTKNKNLNFVDMLIVTTIQYRVPLLYLNLQHRTDDIVNKLCSSLGMHPLNLSVVFAENKKSVSDLKERKPDSNKTQEFLNEILLPLESDPETKDICKNLLEILFPPFCSAQRDMNHHDMLVNKKICHPFVYPLYFQYDGS
ncbi:TPA: hypothetical protein F8R80_16315, partial [Legionella pneumophila]|nr:hypothetical protein [Legionella pneumophila]